MKRSRSYVCLDCDEVFSPPYRSRCPVCGSSAIYPLGKWIAGIPHPELIRRIEKEATCKIPV